MNIQTTVGYATKSATISNTAKAISHADFAWAASDLAAADIAYITARTAGVMLLWTGVVPTATLGFMLAQNANIEVVGNANIQALQFIREAGSDATVIVSLEQ